MIPRIDANAAVRPEAQSAGGACVLSCAVIALAGFVTLLAGAIICAKAKKWGYDGEHVIHDLDMYHTGYKITYAGLGIFLAGACGMGCGGKML
jgi:hypothetical protein